MQKKNVLLGRFCVLLGSVFVIGALLLFAYNQQRQRYAAKASEEMLTQVLQEIEQTVEMQKTQTHKTVTSCHEYLGVLDLPTLGMILPVQADWSYEKLRSSPCVYFGSIEERNLVILGHNYRKHFNPIKRLHLGDEVILTDGSGNSFHYEVKELLVLEATEIDSMIDSEYDLSLFTCNYDGSARVTVRCMLKNPADYFLKETVR